MTATQATITTLRITFRPLTDFSREVWRAAFVRAWTSHQRAHFEQASFLGNDVVIKRYSVRSASDPSMRHEVTLRTDKVEGTREIACDCTGWIIGAHACRHAAAVIDEVGVWADLVPETAVA